MIDTSMFDGHTPNGWYVDDAMDVIHPTVIHSNETDNIIAELVMANAEEWTEEDYANARLMASAPLLLEEVKRLRVQGRKLVEAAERVRSDISDQDTGWYYQLGNHIEKMNRLVSE
tara:strand:- start:477 stop:824 length:348 start_codon:yes stop_codon:yes gene_type:complete